MVPYSKLTVVMDVPSYKLLSKSAELFLNVELSRYYFDITQGIFFSFVVRSVSYFRSGREGGTRGLHLLPNILYRG